MKDEKHGVNFDYGFYTRMGNVVCVGYYHCGEVSALPFCDECKLILGHEHKVPVDYVSRETSAKVRTAERNHIQGREKRNRNRPGGPFQYINAIPGRGLLYHIRTADADYKFKSSPLSLQEFNAMLNAVITPPRP